MVSAGRAFRAWGAICAAGTSFSACSHFCLAALPTSPRPMKRVTWLPEPRGPGQCPWLDSGNWGCGDVWVRGFRVGCISVSSGVCTSIGMAALPTSPRPMKRVTWLPGVEGSSAQLPWVGSGNSEGQSDSGCDDVWVQGVGMSCSIRLSACTRLGEAALPVSPG